MIRTLSQTERARRDTTISRCDDDALDSLSRLYGLTRPASYPVSAWRNLLLNMVYQPRGTFRCLFHVLDALFEPWRKYSEINVSIDASGSFIDTTLTEGHAHRWVRIEDTTGSRYSWLEYVDEATNTAQLNTQKTGYWDVWDSAMSGTLSFLPFIIIESDASIRILIDLSLLETPPTYLQEAGATRPSGQPLGGHLLNLLDLDPETLDFGAHPLYLTGDDISGILGDILRHLIPAGVHVSLEGLQYGADLGFPALSALIETGSL